MNKVRANSAYCAASTISMVNEFFRRHLIHYRANNSDNKLVVLSLK